MLPGVVFGRPEAELTLRLAFVDFDGARTLAAADQIETELPLDETFLRRNCEKVVMAFDLLEEWLEKA